MTDTPSVPPSVSVPEVPPPVALPSGGLRLRIWIGCLGGAAVAGAGMWWVIGTQVQPTPALDLPSLVAWLAAVAGLGIVVGAVLALWLDRGLVAHMRGLNSSLAAADVSQLRGLPAAAGWGELSQLTQQLQLLITHHRQVARAAEELGLARTQLVRLGQTIEHWSETERWVEVRSEGGPLAPLVEALNRGFRRLEEVREQNQEAARQIGSELANALENARDSAEQAERGFVEATAMLTSIRELERLTAELAQAVPAASGEDAGAAYAAWRDAAREAIEELVTSCADSLEHLASGLLKVREIADQVHLLANRSTLVALDATLASTSVELQAAEREAELRQLAGEVRAATLRTTQLAAEIEAAVAAGAERMRDVRTRVAARLDQVPALEPEAAAADPERLARLLARIREMVQDAARKGERLSSASERGSRAAERLVRGLEEEATETSGLVVRLSAPPATPSSTTKEPGQQASGSPSGEASTRPPGLRLLDQEDLPPGDEPRTRRGGPGPGEDR